MSKRKASPPPPSSDNKRAKNASSLLTETQKTAIWDWFQLHRNELANQTGSDIRLRASEDLGFVVPKSSYAYMKAYKDAGYELKHEQGKIFRFVPLPSSICKSLSKASLPAAAAASSSSSKSSSSPAGGLSGSLSGSPLRHFSSLSGSPLGTSSSSSSSLSGSP